MLPNDHAEKGCILMLTIEELIVYLAKDHPLKDFEILVISKDIITESRANRQISSSGDTSITEESRYDNVDFVMNLIPSMNVLSIFYSDGFSGQRGEVFDQFREAYEGQLSSDDAMTELICIADMVVNDHISIILLCAPLDKKMGYPGVLTQFITDMFGIKCYMVDEIIDPNIDVTDIGNRDEIVKTVNDLKCQFSEVNEAEGFFNHLVDSVRGKYKELLMKKDTPQLIQTAMNVGAVLRRKDSREQIIDRIIDAMTKRSS